MNNFIPLVKRKISFIISHFFYTRGFYILMHFLSFLWTCKLNYKIRISKDYKIFAIHVIVSDLTPLLVYVGTQREERLTEREESGCSYFCCVSDGKNLSSSLLFSIRGSFVYTVSFGFRKRSQAKSRTVWLLQKGKYCTEPKLDSFKNTIIS